MCAKKFLPQMTDYTIEEIIARGGKVLLHACCAPCSGAIIEYMVQHGLKPTVFFSNSNIYTREEYEKRKAEVLRYCALFGLEVVDDDYDHADWLDSVRGLEHEPERGRRCERCFGYRLERAVRYAAAHGYDVLTTTLASSRWKDLDQVNAAGAAACAMAENPSIPVLWWAHNWRKGGLQERRAQVIREQNFYNQTFCGCEFGFIQRNG